MDVTSTVYSSVAADVAFPIRPPMPLIDEDVELARPKPQPLRQPRLARARLSRPFPVEDSNGDVDITAQEARTSRDLPCEERGEIEHPVYAASPTASREDDEEAGTTSPNGTRNGSVRRRKHESFLLTGSVFLVTNEGCTLSLPIPSDSVLDPLNWGAWRKAGALLAVGWYSVVALTAVQAASLLLEGMGDDFKDEESHPWTLETVVTAPTLFMGIGALLWVPLSLALGRRPVFLLAALLNFVATLGAGYSRTLRELLFFVCLLGLGEGFALTPAFLMVIDLTFIDQRPKAIAAFWSVAGFIGVSSLSLVPYFSNHGEDWHLFYRRWAPMTGSALVLAYLLYPETYFKRPTVAFNGLILLQSATEKLTVYEDHETEASPDLYKDLPGYPFAPDSKPSILQRLGLARSPFASFTSMGACYAQILFCFLNPLIFWVLLASIFNFAGMMFIGATYARILSAPPYSLPSSLLIHVNNASALGSLLGYPCAGIAVGALIKRLVKRNKGVLEAEHYLIAYILPVLAGAASTLLYGLAVHHTLHFTVYYLAYGLNGFSWVCLAIANTMWVTEAFPRWAAPALVVVNGGCYLLSFSMSFALVPWIAAHGYLLVGVELTVLQVLGGAVALPIAFWGRTARQAIHGRWAGERGGALRPL